MLAAENLGLVRGNQQVLSDVSMTIEPACINAVIGPNGAGKSSLLGLLAGEEQPDRGQVVLDGVSTDLWSPAELARKRAVMSQTSSIVFDFSVDQVLEMGWVYDNHWGPRVMAQAIDITSRACGIADLRHRNYRTLSGGEQQRVQFCRALLQIWQPEEENENRYLLLDEPTSSLDVAHELLLLELLQETRVCTGVLIILHDLNLAAHFADKVHLLHDGEVVASGTPEVVMTAARLTEVYGTNIQVEERSGQPYIYTH